MISVPHVGLERVACFTNRASQAPRIFKLWCNNPPHHSDSVIIKIVATLASSVLC